MRRLLFIGFFIIVGFITIGLFNTGIVYAQEGGTEEEIEEIMITGIGIGSYVNTLNFSVGPTIIFWLFEDLGIQGTYGVGIFTSHGVRGLYRISISPRLGVYLGSGYLHAEKKANIVGIDTTIEGDGFDIFGGIEWRIFKKKKIRRMPRKRERLLFYMEVSRAFIEVETEVTGVNMSARASAAYAPYTFGAGLVYYP